MNLIQELKLATCHLHTGGWKELGIMLPKPKTHTHPQQSTCHVPAFLETGKEVVGFICYMQFLIFHAP